MNESMRAEVCVGAVVIDGENLLLIQRGRGPAKGRWSVPGGRVEPGETLAAAVEREVAEETGLAVECGEFIGWVERLGDDHHYLIMDFAASLSRPLAESAPAVAADDAAAVAWVPLAELADHDLVDGMVDFLAHHGIIPG